MDGRLTITEQPDQLTIAIAGVFNYMLHQEFLAAFRKSEVKARYVVDMTQVERIDSAALGLLLLLYQFQGQQKEALTLEAPPLKVRTILDEAGFDRLFTIH